MLLKYNWTQNTSGSDCIHNSNKGNNTIGYCRNFDDATNTDFYFYRKLNGHSCILKIYTIWNFKTPWKFR